MASVDRDKSLDGLSIDDLRARLNLAPPNENALGSLLDAHHALLLLPVGEIIAWQMELEAEDVFAGEIEVDESYFGGHRKGKRGRGAGGKTAVFGILKRGGQVYTQIIMDAKL